MRPKSYPVVTGFNTEMGLKDLDGLGVSLLYTMWGPSVISWFITPSNYG